MSQHTFALNLQLTTTLKMKNYFPDIQYFDDLNAYFSLTRGAGSPYSINPENEPEGMKKHRFEVLEALWKNKDALIEVEDKMLNYLQEMIILDPQVSVARTTDRKTGNEYFTAKTAWPIRGGRKREIKIHLGKAEEFADDTQNTNAKLLAVRKMKETLRRRKDSGEI